MSDDDFAPMTLDQRAVWVYLVTVVVTSGAYFALILSRLADQPAEDVSWVVPMLWAIGISIVGTIVGSIVTAIGSAVGLAARGQDPHTELGSDERDKDIKRYGDRKTQGVMAFAMFGGLVLSMADADTFWIGNFLFLMGTVGALVETTVKIRAYRRGF